MPSRSENFAITLEFEGRLYEAIQTVVGTHVRTQFVTMGEHRKHDDFGYAQEQTNYMNGVARQMLWELVQDTFKPRV